MGVGTFVSSRLSVWPLSAYQIQRISDQPEGGKEGGEEGERGEEPPAPKDSPEMERWILKKIKYLQSGGLSPSDYNFKVRERQLDLGFPILSLCHLALNCSLLILG